MLPRSGNVLFVLIEEAGTMTKIGDALEALHDAKCGTYIIFTSPNWYLYCPVMAVWEADITAFGFFFCFRYSTASNSGAG